MRHSHADCNWRDTAGSLEIDEFTGQRASSCGGGTSVLICDVVCMVMGSSWVADTERDISSGNKDYGLRICSQLQYALHFHHCTSILINVVSHACLHFLLLRRLDSGHGAVRFIFIA